MVKKGPNTPEKQKSTEGEGRAKMKMDVLKSSKGAYLGCLFLIIAEKRYKPVKSSYARDS